MIKILKKLIRSLLLGNKKPEQVYPFTNHNPKYAKFSIGDYTYGDPIIDDFDEKLTIGKYCSIARGVTFVLGGEHNTNWATTYPFNTIFLEKNHIKGHPLSKGPILVGNDVWLGTDAIVLSGVSIGDGAVVAARSVVTKNIPPYAIVGGNPAKILKFRFDDASIEKLLKLKWWEMPHNQVLNYADLLMSSNIDEVINKLGNNE
jgi:acetyltransferase-like isoleucine patch superfamily enzyme